MKIVLAGLPNAGKTSLFNRLTGSEAPVANYPGVTVKYQAALALGFDQGPVEVVDLPGTYSLASRSLDESDAEQVLRELRPDDVQALVAVIDAQRLSQGLYLVSQLIELGLPMVLAVNQIDAFPPSFSASALASRLGVPVVLTSAHTGQGLAELKEALTTRTIAPLWINLDPNDEELLLRLTHGDAALAGAPHPVPRTARWSVVAKNASTSARELFARGITRRYQLVDELLESLGAPAKSSAQATQVAAPQTSRLDRWLLGRLTGLPSLILIVFVFFQTIFTLAEPLVTAIEELVQRAAEVTNGVLDPGLTRSLLVDGALAGVGNVLVFIPPIALMFLGLALLEESGYLARAAVVADRLMRTVGLSGRSFVPMLGGYACAVPSILATRSLPSRRERLLTMLLIPLMSCSARLPIYIMVTSALFSQFAPLFGFISVPGFVFASMYLLALLAAWGVGWLLRSVVGMRHGASLMLELPQYRAPSPVVAVRRSFRQVKSFVTGSGPTIVALSMVLWALLSFPRLPVAEEPSAPVTRTQAEHSIAGRVGKAIEPMLRPLGFDWQIGVGLIASFAAREVMVSALGQVYALDGDVDADAETLREALRRVDPRTGRPNLTPLAGVSLMAFFAIALQCMSTVAVLRQETGGWQWPLGHLVLLNGLAYAVSLSIFQIGRLLGFT